MLQPKTSAAHQPTRRELPKPVTHSSTKLTELASDECAGEGFVVYCQNVDSLSQRKSVSNKSRFHSVPQWMDPLYVSVQFTVFLIKEDHDEGPVSLLIKWRRWNAGCNGLTHCTLRTIVFHYTLCALKSNNSHRLLISCTCTAQTIRRTRCTRSSSSTTATWTTAGFTRNTAGGELGRLAEHLPPHRPRSMLITRLMPSTRKA